MGNKCTTEKFSNYYKPTKKIGQGEFAKVYKCKRKSDKKEFAVKVVDKKNYGQEELEGLEHEIGILQTINYENVIQMIDVFDNKRKVKIVLELCEHDLMHKIEHSPNGRLSEARASKIVYTLAKTLHHLNENGVVHRDLKPQNILFTKDGVLKLTDFGIAHFDNKYKYNIHFLDNPCGTPYYVAPEILLGKYYSYKIDYWSLGVILYFMLSGLQPFAAPNISTMYKKIIKGEYSLDFSEFDDISVEAKHLIRRLLCVDPKKRITFERLRKHRWIRKYNKDRDSSNVQVVSMDKAIDIPVPFTMHRQQSLEKAVIENYATVNIHK